MLNLIPCIPQKPDYRADLDGLRALAIIAVIFYHLELPFMPGGFIGVDIFLVLSGFLIARIVRHEYEAGSFSYIGFLERRLRRIYPALALTVAAVVLAGYFLIMFPADRILLGSTLMAQALLSPEMLFMFINSYFDTSLQQNLLLHAWTLGVELKFYLLFPLLWLAARWGRRALIITLTLVVSVVSFALCLYFTEITPSATALTFKAPWLAAEAFNRNTAYFFFATRFWEFLAGALLALVSVQIEPRGVREVLALLGLGLIGYSAMQFDSSLPYPSWNALIPVGGAAALMLAHSGGHTLVSRFLTLPPLIGIGLISYGLYLWHWPLLVLTKLRFGELNFILAAAVITLTIVLALASYTFIETPIRTRRFLASSLSFWIFVLITLAATFAAGLWIKHSWVADGRIWDRPEREIIARYDCSLTVCYFGEQVAPKRTILLWGDSQALSIAPLIEELAEASDTRVIAMIINSCPPLYDFGERIFMEPRRERCEDATAEVRQLLATERIDTAILMARWSAYTVWDDGLDSRVHMESTEDEGDGPEASAAAFDQHTRKTIEQLQELGIDVVAVDNIPGGNDFDIREKFYAYLHDRDPKEEVLVTRAAFAADAKLAPSALMATYETGSYTLLRPADILCDEASCYSIKDGTLLYRDAAHLNHFGVFSLMPLFEPLFR